MMNTERTRSITIVSNSLIAVAFCLQLPVAVLAQDAGRLVPETASMDAAPPRDSAQPIRQISTTSSATTLYGSAKKHQPTLDGNGTTDTPQNSPMTLNATDNAAKLQSEQGSSAAANLYTLAVKKLVAGAELSSDEYRSLGAGCAGMETDRTFFQKVGRVSVVYPGSPADQAGIRVGDKVIQNDNDEQAKADPTKPLWEVMTGQAGTPVDITLLRHKKPVTLTLIRMNIEDIQDTKIRQMWERMISNLGYPKEGTFIAPSLRSLEGR